MRRHHHTMTKLTSMHPDPPPPAPQPSMLRWSRDVAVTFVAGLLLYGAVLAILHKVNQTHWLVGTGATLFYALAVALGLSDLRSDPVSRLPIHKGIGIALLTVFTGIAVAASLSYQLLRAGWADYEPAPPPDQAYLVFNAYYFHVMLDLLPGLDAAKTLSFEAPLQPKNWVAGLPVVAFRAFIIFGVVAGVRAWWVARKTRANAPPKTFEDEA